MRARHAEKIKTLDKYELKRVKQRLMALERKLTLRKASIEIDRTRESPHEAVTIAIVSAAIHTETVKCHYSETANRLLPGPVSAVKEERAFGRPNCSG